ncbi:transcriptional regulator [Natrinema versiforme]|uniref:Transcriptional regulator n=1 Tax=Natrinema versiforme TaxID=88724 RepID=A0A4P8WLT9_9EURY|nr:transcriptional regulator [Natrinema versiforme]QCS43173.1 transcriptional regulator [Natrinema versiforme]
MDPRTQERVEEWDSRQFSGGFDGLSDLADADFSGAVSAVGTWLFMLNGRIIGVVDGDIEDFETASGTRYEAPHPSLPLLCAMEERGGETRAKYYTNETPLREVDNTLQSGSFTGYIELSENVLSGDYYAVYYGGRRMAAAYIGNAGRLLTGDEAFDRAADEVGIYEVTDVEIEVTDVPGTTGPDTGDGSTSADGSPNGVDSRSEPAPADDPGAPDRDGSSADPAPDSTGSSIEPINVSSTESAGAGAADSDPIEDVTVDDPSSLASDIDLTGDPSGITATDETPTEPETTSAGITDTEPAATDLDPTTDPDPSPESDPSDDGSEPREQGSTERSTDDSPAAAERGDAADSRTDESPVDDSPVGEPAGADAVPTTGDESASSSPADEALEADPDDAAAVSDTEPTATSSPDLAEVEAAAEELERNDISWVDEDGDEEDAGDDGDGGDDSPDQSAADDATATADDARPDADEDEGDLEEQFEREEAWRETRRIPSIDPDNSESDESTASSGGRPGGQGSRSAAASTAADAGTEPATAAPSDGAQSDSKTAASTTAAGQSSETREQRSQTRSRQQESQESGRAQTAESVTERSRDASEDRERIAALTEKLETLQEQRDALVEKAEELEAERDRLRSENDELSSTVDRLQSRIEELETELERERARTQDTGDAESDGVGGGTQLTAQQALSGTNLFVRYASKSQPTLEKAHDGAADRNDVAANLQLEHHTQFDSADAVVDGDPFADFLASSMEYRFVDWLTEMLLYEIRDTGNADGLGDLYDAIPRIDRAELDATISLEDDDTEDVPDQVTFDVVAFDKMGNPLVLVTLNDSREPASTELLEGLEEAASAVKANYPDLAAAIAVTSSYFEPGALEVAEQATSGGFLSRGSKLSYVNLSRKEGYHLCLVESRSEGFHMNVPEL